MKISGAESLVMEALWREAPQTSEQLCATVGPEQNWSEPTVRTLLRRLVAKGAVSTTAEGRRFFYSPVLSRADYVASESQGLVDRLFNGSLGALVSHFSEREALTQQDLDELREIVKRIEDNG